MSTRVIRGYIKPLDIFVYGFFTLVGLSAALLYTFLTEDFVVGEAVTLYSASGSMIVICCIVFIKIYYSTPKWITAQGVGVWEDIPWFDSAGKIKLNKAIDIFVSIVAKERQISKYSLLATISKLRIEWTTAPISLVGIGWTVSDKNGVQQGNNVMVRWMGTLADSALVHEMIHFVRTQHCHLETDYKHEDPDWWYLERIINNYIRNTVVIGEC